MSEFNKFQLSEFFSQGGQIVVRTDDVLEGIDMFEVAAKEAVRIVDASTALRNLAKVKGSLSEEKPAVKASSNASSAPARAGSAQDLCDHGLPWNDLSGEVGKNGEPYKYRLYCAFKTNNWKERCSPRN